MNIERILIIGSGSIGSRHLDICRNMFANAEIKLMHHAQSKAFENIYNSSLKSISEAIDFKPNLTIVANPAAFHVESAQALAENGSHLLIEKPISINSNDVKKLIQTCQSKNLILQVGYNLRFSASLQKYKEIISSGQIGEVYEIHCRAGQYLPDWRPDTDYRRGVSAQKDLGGGALLELSHEIDYLRWIFGEIRWVSGKLSKESDLEIDVEDTAHFKLGFKEALNSRKLVADVRLDFIQKIPVRKCTASGNKANLEWNGLTGEVTMIDKTLNSREQVFIDEMGLSKTYEYEWKGLVEAINTGGKPLVTGVDGLRVIEIIEAIRNASSKGGKVDVVYDHSVIDK